jgi:hypothetical protein
VGDGGTCEDPEWSLWPAPADSPAAGSYATTPDTVWDGVTGLTWQRSVPALMLWSDAVTYCDGLVLGGFSDWRLPSVVELVSIVDYGRVSPSIDTIAFPATPIGVYFSMGGAGQPGGPANVPAVDFTEGKTVFQWLIRTAAVRCVR